LFTAWELEIFWSERGKPIGMGYQQRARGLRSAEKGAQDLALLGRRIVEVRARAGLGQELKIMGCPFGIGGLLDGPGPDASLHSNGDLLQCHFHGRSFLR